MRIERFLAGYETPIIFPLGPNLHAAQFRLMKLLPARFMFDRAEDRGELRPAGDVVETSSGTFALALAMLTASRGYHLTIVSASSLIDAPFKLRLEELGAQVLLVEDRQGTGEQAGRLSLLRSILQAKPHTFWPRQYDNPDNPAAYSRLAELLVERIGPVDCLVGCVGSGGSLCGTASYLGAIFPALKVIAVDTHGSVLFGHRPARRLLRGLGNSIVPGNLDHSAIDEVHWIGAFHAFEETRDLHRHHALFIGPTSGAAARVARWYARAHPTETVVTIMPDEGYRYQSTVYSDEWLEAQEGWLRARRNEPIELHKIEPASESDWTFTRWSRRIP